MDKRIKKHGYYEVNCGVFDTRDSEMEGPYNVTISIIANHDKLNEVHSQMNKILCRIYQDKSDSERMRDAEFVQDHFRQLYRRDLIESVLVGVSGIDDTPESLIDALDNNDVKFVN